MKYRASTELNTTQGEVGTRAGFWVMAMRDALILIPINE